MHVKIDSQDRNTILAALRTYQAAGYGEPCNRPLPIHDIATNMDCEISMDAAGIDDLCERLNCDCNEPSAGTMGELFAGLREDFALLESGEWVPDTDSIQASVDALDEIERRCSG
jgi:hypothetical protein